MKSLPAISADMQALKKYIEVLPDGKIVSFEAVASDTGIKMDTKGKQFLRAALSSLHREYASITGWGIELSSPANAVSLVNHRLIKIDNAVRRGEKTANRCMHFLDAMDDKDSKQLLFVASVFGAIRASASLAKSQYRTNKEKVIDIKN